MNFTVINKGLRVDRIHIMGVSSSSTFIVGDTQWITCSSIFDTPPESVIVGLPPIKPSDNR